MLTWLVYHIQMRASVDRYGRTAMDYFDPVNSAKWAEVAVVDTAAFPVRSVLSDKMGNGTGLEDILLSEVSVCECFCVCVWWRWWWLGCWWWWWVWWWWWWQWWWWWWCGERGGSKSRERMSKLSRVRVPVYDHVEVPTSIAMLLWAN
jgi:hypothetical protein